MPICCVVNCHFKPKPGSGRTFHKFPFSNPAQLRKWVTNIRRDKWFPKKTSVICSDHFSENWFDRTGQTTRLRVDAIPTIFNFPAHLTKTVKKRKSPKKRTSPETQQPDVSSIGCDEPCDSEPIVSSVRCDGPSYLESELGRLGDQADHPEALPIASAEHHYNESPTKTKRKLNEMHCLYGKVQKRLKVSQQAVRRLKKEVRSMKELIDSLKKNGMVTHSAADILQTSFSGAPLAMFSRMWNNKNVKKTNSTYSPVLRSFAMTLQFYSPKGYDFVRKTFNLALPCPSTIRTWYSKVDGDPGYCKTAFTTLKEHVYNASLKNDKIVCSLMIDEMSIRKQIEWDGKRFQGYVDIGAGVDDDDLPVATEALVFMVVALNTLWKLPVGYFLASGLSGKERSNLVKECLIRLHDTGVIITSLTCDGPSCHFNMANCLGANLTMPNPQVWFPHPADKSLKVYIILDVCHMLKLVRNTWDALKMFKDRDGNEIRWDYIKELHKVQEEEGLRAGTRLRKAHVEWNKQKMKVNLAAQTISSSVSDAIEFCNVDLKLKAFKGSEATVAFIRIIDRLFDLLNSRNPWARGYKAPMKKCNELFWKPFIEKTLQYILELTDITGNPLYKTKRKTGFIGFYISAKSIQDLFSDLVKAPGAPLKYLLTYKFSQAHLELFFCAIRARGGWNNNPTVRQFASAFKRLIMRHEIVCSNGNVCAQDNTSILPVQILSEKTDLILEKVSTLDTLDLSLARKYDLQFSSEPLTDHDYHDVPDLDRLSLYSENVVAYIAGYVVIMVERIIHCEDCIAALQSNEDRSCLALLLRKTRGGLVKVANDVIQVCVSTEQCIRRMLKTNDNKLPQCSGVTNAICNIVLQEINSRVTPPFDTLKDHMFDSAPNSNHVFRLIKTIASCFLKIRFHHLARRYTVCKQFSN